MKIVTGANVESAEAGKDEVKVTYGGETETFDYLCIAAGRAPDVEELGLEDAGIERDERGLVKVDGRCAPRARGVGDRRHGARARPGPQGLRRGHHRRGGRRRRRTHPIDYRFVPAVTFCHPQVASFGLTEKEAHDEGHDVVVGKVPMGAVGAPTVYGDRGGLVKIVGDAKYGELLGAHIVSVKAADLIEELVVAHDLEGGYAEVARTIHPHPAFAEAVMEAARATDGWLIHG